MGKAQRPGGKSPETFGFLGFTHIATRSQREYFTIHMGTMRKRLKAIAGWCKEHRHDTLDEQQEALNKKLRGTGDPPTTGADGGSIW